MGYNYGGSITNCYSNSLVGGKGGLVGYNRDGIITNCYSVGPDISDSDGGGLVGSGPANNVANSFWDIETSGQTASDGGTGKTTAEMQTAKTFLEAGWDFVGETANGTEDIWWIIEGKDYPHLWWEEPQATPHTPYAGGSGEPNDPYQIATAEDLILLGVRTCDYGKHFILTADINMEKVPGPLFLGHAVIASSSLPYFTGVFDGNGHTISNLTVGLFGSLGTGAEVRDLGLVDVNISSGSGSISMVNNGNIINCYCTGKISGRWHVGGLVGTNSGGITACYSTCTVNGDKYVGGLVGENDLFGSITNCYSTGKISGDELVGGLVGENDLFGSVTISYSTGFVSGGVKSGGLVGSNCGNVTQCHSTSSVSGTSSIGGLVGDNSGDVTQCFSNGMVSAFGHDISEIGGLVGDNSYGIVTQCYSTGAVSTTGELSTVCVGGLVGNNSGDVIQCYSTGFVSANGQFTVGIGGLVGRGSTVTYSVWNIETSGLSESACGVGLTTAQMQTASTFLEAGWDFVGETENGTEDIWWILEGKDYPRLWWEESN